MAPANFQDFRVDKWVSIATYYRILAPRILPINIDKVLYLDSDIIVRGSLNDLWNTDLRDRALAAVGELADSRAVNLVGLPPGAKYFNGGVLLINLAFWRENSIYERATAFIRDNPEKVELWDQDALNAILVHSWIELPAHWNAQHHFITGLPAARIVHLTPEQRAMVPLSEPAVVHFDGDTKPWHWSCRHPFQYEYRKYRLKTPWPQYRLEGKPRLHCTTFSAKFCSGYAPGEPAKVAAITHHKFTRMAELALPAVSVIIPFLNPGLFLREAIESVIAQTDSDWELLLVDDGATDGSADIAHSYAERHPEKHFLSGPPRTTKLWCECFA